MKGLNGIKGYDMYRQGCNILKYYNNGGIAKSIKQKPVIFVVAAASVAGKGTLLETVGETSDKSIIRIITKQAKREPKSKDKRDGMVAIGKNGSFGDGFDIIWEFHKKKATGKGTEYAINSSEISTNIEKGFSQIVISNMQQFEMFKEKYNDRIVFIYLHRLQSREDKESYLLTHEIETDAIDKLNESDEVYEEYIERIVEFDHVLLNTSFQEDLYEQIFTLIEHYNN
jgi:guanylate kinase